VSEAQAEETAPAMQPAQAKEAKEAKEAKVPRVTVVSGPKRPMGRVPLIFAAVAVVVALAAAALVLTRDGSQAPTRTPEETVREFLAAVFLANSRDRVAQVVCGSWDPAEAIERTSGEAGRNVRVSWDEFAVVTSDQQQVTMRGRLGLRDPDDLRPGSFVQWRFHLVNEDGWRVCEARPFIS
jgi:hypothetical protein